MPGSDRGMMESLLLFTEGGVKDMSTAAFDGVWNTRFAARNYEDLKTLILHYAGTDLVTTGGFNQCRIRALPGKDTRHYHHTYFGR